MSVEQFGPAHTTAVAPADGVHGGLLKGTYLMDSSQAPNGSFPISTPPTSPPRSASKSARSGSSHVPFSLDFSGRFSLLFRNESYFSAYLEAAGAKNTAASPAGRM